MTSNLLTNAAGAHGSHERWAMTPADLMAVGLVAMLAAVIVLLALGSRVQRLIAAAATVGGGFQLAHLAEHAAQTGYWAAHPDNPPWMTPWADALMTSYQSLAPGTPGFGLEAMHLVGNAIFLVGAIALWRLLVATGRPGDARLARIAAGVQLVHVAEHVALTATVVLVGRPIGVSTLFGTADPGPALWTYRIWWHLAVNLTATTLIAIGVIRHLRADPARRIGAKTLIRPAA